MAIDQWLLADAERGNPASTLGAWSDGNAVHPLVHGAVYFERLVHEVEELAPDDHLLFTDWRGDPDELMRPDGPTVGELFSAAARSGRHGQGAHVACPSWPVVLQRDGEPSAR